MTLKTLIDLIGAQALGDHLTAAVQDLVDREQLDSAEAYRRITDVADVGDPAVLAATRQTWVRRPDVDPEEAPVRRLYVLERTGTEVFVAYADIDTAADATDAGQACVLPSKDLWRNDHSQGAEFGVELLDLYQLEAWEPFEFLLPTVGGIGNVRPAQK
ncbi:hypothetical protein [Streptomyces sp. NBC_00154]|uniref:hypothetical protein n=1 Tax=Streptomyces sp. NBC_00154 TaxID=2975670 RepID=UPI002258A0FD|nr:hypothetical protein [Streptomyces sp. NBC_00154]MCX5318109.1 hypothetical protein [Streptomyces sp. NBC_00154]